MAGMGETNLSSCSYISTTRDVCILRGIPNMTTFGTKCGYCNGEDTFYFEATMEAIRTTPSIRQTMLEHGWERCGNFLYITDKNRNCCPMYLIRLKAEKYRATKSQKKILRKMTTFLKFGDLTEHNASKHSAENYSELSEFNIINTENVISKIEPHTDTFNNNNNNNNNYTNNNSNNVNNNNNSNNVNNNNNNNNNINNNNNNNNNNDDPPNLTQNVNIMHDNNIALQAPNIVYMDETPELIKSKCLKAGSPTKGVGADPQRPKCKKAKDIRNQRREKKLQLAQISSQEHAKTTAFQPSNKKSLEDYLIEHDYKEGYAHRLESQLVLADPSSPKFVSTFAESFALYKKYQMAIHKDEEHKCTESNFNSFLVESNIETTKSHLEFDYGVYHQQYFLDGKLIMVSAIDVLPNYVCSNYLYYDPDYLFLSPGTYTIMREIAFTRKFRFLNNAGPTWLGLGLYSHYIQRVSYKGNFSPSYLHCPFTHQWVEFEKCLTILSSRSRMPLTEFDSKCGKSQENHLDSLLVEIQQDGTNDTRIVSLGDMRKEGKFLNEYGMNMVKQYYDWLGTDLVLSQQIALRLFDV